MKRALNFMNKGASIDADAQAFITSSGLTNPIHISAINTLVTDLKTNNLWSKIKVFYPFIGGTSFTHKWNLKDPRDLNSAFRIVWYNEAYIDHSSSGVKGVSDNGAQYGNTFFKDSDFNNYNDCFFFKYTKYYTNSWELGNINSSAISRLATFSTSTYYQVHGNLNNITCDNYGLFVANRSTSTNSQLFVNSVKKADLTDPTASGTNSLYYALLSQWSDGRANNATSLWKCAGFGGGFTETDQLNFYTIVQNYQTELGRQD